MKKLNLTINPLDKKSHINREIYGNFSEHLGRCIYDGIYVGENSDIPNIEGFRKDVIEAFRQIKLPVLRWPGGCFADAYHWKDGIGDKETRKKMINIHWGGVVEDNSFGTHEFLRFCELVGCEPYIAGNVGSGTVEEMAEWIEYMTFDGISPMAELRKKNGREQPWKLKYFGIGNENWGCGGNMTPEYYCDTYRRYQSYCRDFSGNNLYKIACGPNAYDYNWTEVCMKNITPWNMKGLSLHYYTVPYGNWEHKGSATDFTEAEYYETINATLQMETLVTRHSEIMNRYDPEKKVGLIVDEWGCWFDVEEGTNPGFLYQQNTMRDAIVAAINLNIFNSHSDRVFMANIAQAVNVLQAILLTEGSVTVKTPTFHVFDLYKEHQDATLIYSHAENEATDSESGVPCISHSASINENGDVFVTLSNCALNKEFEIDLGTAFGEFVSAEARMLTGDAHDHNDFTNTENVMIKSLDVKVENGRASVVLPACSVAAVTLKLR
ncbi:MAG: alpha-N-arabinofuranosidase [Oscillospiraceae bacterium]|nr:alpha-N-arabinofuranosidase [Oscillospiraceae bacterium]